MLKPQIGSKQCIWLPYMSFHFGDVYLKKSEPILRAIGSAGRIPPEPPFRPPRLACPTNRREAEAKRTISSFSRALAC